MRSVGLGKFFTAERIRSEGATPFGVNLRPANSTVLLLHNRDLSEYVIPYRSFDESFNYHKQLLRNYKNIV